MGGATEELIAQLRADYGLDKSVPRQFFTHIVRMAQGNLGESFSYDQPVLQLILERLPATLILVVTALVMAILIGTLLGVIAAQKPKSFFSGFVTVVSLAGYTAPRFLDPELCC